MTTGNLLQHLRTRSGCAWLHIGNFWQLTKAGIGNLTKYIIPCLHSDSFVTVGTSLIKKSYSKITSPVLCRCSEAKKKKKKFSCFSMPVIYLLRILFFFLPFLLYCYPEFLDAMFVSWTIAYFVLVSIKTCLWWISGSLSLFTLKGMAWSMPCCYSTINGICPEKGLEGLQYHSEPMLRAKIDGEAFFLPPL